MWPIRSRIVIAHLSQHKRPGELRRIVGLHESSAFLALPLRKASVHRKDQASLRELFFDLTMLPWFVVHSLRVAWDSGDVVIRFTTDGDTWQKLDVPAGAGRPSDITRYRGSVVVLTERGLWRL